jgi:hypothetical protein
MCTDAGWLLGLRLISNVVHLELTDSENLINNPNIKIVPLKKVSKLHWFCLGP